MNEFEYGCVMLELDFVNWFELITNINANDLNFDQLASGICMDPHLTILYGIHNDVPLRDVESIIQTVNKSEIDIKLGQVEAFCNDEYDVIKIGVESEYLTKLNAKFSKLPNSNAFPEYKPHITVAYVNPGASEKYLNMYYNPAFTIGYIKYSNGDILNNY